MSSIPTVEDLFEVAIEAERTVEAVYDAFHYRFAAYAPVAAFWHSYAREEAGHARRLEQIRAGIGQGDLAHTADTEMFETARRNLIAAQKARTVEVRNLDDAYQLAHELEHSEVNTILELLVDNYADDPRARGLVRSHLREHIDRLMNGFPAPFTGPEARSAVLPRDTL